MLDAASFFDRGVRTEETGSSRGLLGGVDGTRDVGRTVSPLCTWECLDALDMALRLGVGEVGTGGNDILFWCYMRQSEVMHEGDAWIYLTHPLVRLLPSLRAIIIFKTVQTEPDAWLRIMRCL